MSAAAQFNIATLLEMAGAKPPRNGWGKWGCPDCGRPAHVSVDFAKEAFKCWHAGCDFRGYGQTLENRLGLGRKLNRAEERKRQIVLNESRSAAEWLTGELRAHRLKLIALHRRVLKIHDRTVDRLKANISDEQAWSMLALVYRGLPEVRVALALV